MTDQPRDYRDEADIDEQLDVIRVAPRDQARMVYRDSLDVAYHQGRTDILSEHILHFPAAVQALIREMMRDIHGR